MNIDNSSNIFAYQERFVAFLDILGFSDIIHRTVLSPPEISINEIISALVVPEPAQKGKLIIGNVGDISKSDHKITQFSDSIVISTESTKAGLLHLIDHIERIAFSLLKMGFLCRGGVSKGLLFHDENIVFGPAMIDAYDLESKEAICPRIVLSKGVESFILSMSGGERIVIERKLFKYPDFYIVHVLRLLAFALSTSGKGDEWEIIYLNIKRHLNTEIARLKNDSNKQEKVISFKNYFDETVHADGIKIIQAVMKTNNQA